MKVSKVSKNTENFYASVEIIKYDIRHQNRPKSGHIGIYDLQKQVFGYFDKKFKLFML
jgi:hypothetical protein